MPRKAAETTRGAHGECQCACCDHSGRRPRVSPQRPQRLTAPRRRRIRGRNRHDTCALRSRSHCRSRIRRSGNRETGQWSPGNEMRRYPNVDCSREPSRDTCGVNVTAVPTAAPSPLDEYRRRLADCRAAEAVQERRHQMLGNTRLITLGAGAVVLWLVFQPARPLVGLARRAGRRVRGARRVARSRAACAHTRAPCGANSTSRASRV